MTFSLYYIAKPYKVNQKWGVPNSVYKQFGFTLHNGEDCALGQDKMVYCPIPSKHYRTLWQPSGGGNVLSVLTDMFSWEDGKKAKVLIDFMHLEKILVKEGQVFDIGQKLAIADNTGFSTGSHTHIQCRRVVEIGGELLDVDANQANNSFDHSKYYIGTYATDFIKPPLKSDEEGAIIEEQKSFIKILFEYLKLLVKFKK